MSKISTRGILFLVRHGETPLSGRFCGSGVNPSLNRRGRVQANTAARCLDRFSFDAAYVSPLRRAQQTARIIQQRLKIPLNTRAALKEIRFGAWEGLTYQDIEKKWPRLARQWARDPMKVHIPRAESFTSLRQRVRRFLVPLRRRLSTKNILLVAHGATLAAVVLEIFASIEQLISQSHSTLRIGPNDSRKSHEDSMLIYITGGARSGKSRYAQTLASQLGKRVLFVATATPSDADLKRRIARHRRERPKHWQTLENPKDLSKVFNRVDRRTEVLLLDCLTLYVAGCLMQKIPESKIGAQVEKFCKTAASSPITTLIVSNEVGSGLVPTTELGNKFRDYLGRANVIAARYATEAYLMVSGIPVPLKGSDHGR